MKLRIGGQDYTVDTHADSDPEAHWGLCQRFTSTLWINGTVGAELRRAVLMHEMTHAACPWLNEEQVDRIADEIYAALRDNGMLNERRWRELVR